MTNWRFKDYIYDNAGTRTYRAVLELDDWELLTYDAKDLAEMCRGVGMKTAKVIVGMRAEWMDKMSPSQKSKILCECGAPRKFDKYKNIRFCPRCGRELYGGDR